MADTARSEGSWAKPVSTLTVTEVPAGAPNLVEGKRLLGPVQGFGKMWQKTYSMRLDGVETTPQAVISALQRDPSIDYVVAPIDSAATFVSEGVRSAGKAGKVKVSGYEGDPDAVARVRDGDVQAATIADPPEWMGWQAMDALARAFADQDPETVKVPSRLLVSGNAPDTEGWQGDLDFRSELEQLWGT